MANKRIDVDAEIDRIRLKEQTGDPSTPSNGYGWLFEKNDGEFYFMNDAGEVRGPLGKRFYTITIAGALTVDPNPLRIYNLTGRTLAVKRVHLAVDTAPTGSAIIVDIHENGTTIFTTQGNRPQITDGANTGQSTTIDDTSWADGNYIQAEVDQIGSTTAGENLTITVEAV